jgi:hypothetical protein
MAGRPRFSSLCLILAAFSTNLAVVLGLLLIRSALSQMDVPKRQHRLSKRNHSR